MKETIAKTMFPYCIQQLQTDDGVEDEWILLNRNYKPVGMTVPYRDFVQYETAPCGLMKCKIPKRIINKLKNEHGCSEYIHSIYFYQDITAPWRGKEEMDRYLAILDTLMKIKIEKDKEWPLLAMKTAEEIADKVWNANGLDHDETLFDDHWTWEEFVDWIKEDGKKRK